MNFEAIIGLELHVAMKTKSKMFSPAPVLYGVNPNTCINPLDMAFPGTMPTVNKQAVINAIRVGHVLKMSIDDTLCFDRKNYFYSDLPKGYQITQNKCPLCRGGEITIKVNGLEKCIHINHMHLEEDACKQIHLGDRTYIDYNRAGIPLLEIVTEPELSSGEEAMRFVEKIRSIVSFLDVSDGKMEEGTLRCDVNVSIRPIGSSKYGSKVEIKNINTLTNIQKAIDYEIKFQEMTLLSGEKVLEETKRFDESNKKTVPMRIKTKTADYKYFADSNIPPIKLSKEFIEAAIESSPELAEEKLVKYQKLGLSEYDCHQLTANKETCKYFEEILSYGANPKQAANWLIVDIQTILNSKNISISDFTVPPMHIAELISLIKKGIITKQQGREILFEMQDSHKSPSDLIKEKGTSIINDEEILLSCITEILKENPSLINDYRNGKNRVIAFIVGKVMKKTQGKANPELTNKLVERELKKEN